MSNESPTKRPVKRAATVAPRKARAVKKTTVVNGTTRPSLPHGYVSADQVSPRALPWLWNSVLPQGILTLMAGAPGVSKTSIAVDICAQITKGTLPGDLFGQPSSVLYLSREDSGPYSLVPKFRAAEADLSQVFILSDDKAAKITLPHSLKELTETIKRLGVKVVVLDSLMAFMETKRSLHGNYQAAVEAMTPLAEYCVKEGVTVIGMMHLRKDADKTGLNSIIASVGITATARHILIVGKVNEEERVVGVIKSNVGMEHVGRVYEVNYVPIGTDLIRDRMITASKVDWKRPATETEIVNCLDVVKTVHSDSKVMAVLELMRDREQWTVKKLLATGKTGLKERALQTLVQRAEAGGLVIGTFAGQGGAKNRYLTITMDGLAKVTPREVDEDEADDMSGFEAIESVEG